MPNAISPQTRVISKVIKSTLKHCVPGATFREIMRLAEDHESTIESFIQVVQTNPVYSTFFQSLDILSSKIVNWEEEEEDNPARDGLILKKSVQLLNRNVTRNVMAALQINRIRGAGLPRTRYEHLFLSPKEQLNFSSLAEEDCLERELPGSDSAFLAGYHYDVLLALYTTQKAPLEVTMALVKSWTEGLRAARLAAALAANVPSFHHHHYIYGATLVSPIGKVLMAELFPKELLTASWSHFVHQCEKSESKSHLALWVGEFHRFGVSYAELSGLFISFLGFFAPIESAVCFHNNPQNLMEQDSEQYRLAALISVSIVLASFKVEDDFKNHLSSIHLRCLSDLGIPLKNIVAIVEKAHR
ncbi:MAG: hypothetical protein ABI041_14990 [Bdellovibrionia bacterium]